MKHPSRLIAILLAVNCARLIAADTTQRLSDGWEHYQGSLGSTWEVWRGDAASDNVAWSAVTLPHCFNGWGLDTPYTKDNPVPVTVAAALAMPRIDLGTTILEGGAVEHDGNGVMLATRSSILEPKRNPCLTQATLESRLKANLGFTKFIWLTGASGGQDDITDMHIDGFAKFGPNRTLFTMSKTGLGYWGLSAADITTLYNASDIAGVKYTFVALPLTARDVATTNGRSFGYKGSYANFYVANSVVLVPTYNDANDAVAKGILQAFYPGRSIVGIDVRNLYANGGMVHCVTQQLPK